MAKKRLGTDIRQEQIAEAALDIVRSGGVKALSVAAVAEKVGISVSPWKLSWRPQSGRWGGLIDGAGGLR